MLPAADLLDMSSILTSLAIVVALVFAIAWVLRRTPLGGMTRGSGPMKLIATLPIGPKERLLLVEVNGRELIVGVSPGGINAVQQLGDGRRRAQSSEAGATPPVAALPAAPAGAGGTDTTRARPTGGGRPASPAANPSGRTSGTELHPSRAATAGGSRRPALSPDMLLGDPG
jgi:flagellar biosynthetic protein FliO